MSTPPLYLPHDEMGEKLNQDMVTVPHCTAEACNVSEGEI